MVVNEAQSQIIYTLLFPLYPRSNIVTVKHKVFNLDLHNNTEYICLRNMQCHGS